MNIVSISTVFPNPEEKGLGLFVSARLSAMAASSNIKVFAPVPLLDYSSPNGQIYKTRQFRMTRKDGSIEVFHPRWLFPPLGTPINVLCLFLRLYPMLRRARRDFEFDLIDAHFGYPEGVAAALLARALGVPFTITLRGSEPIFASSFFRKLLLQWAFRRANRLIAVSEDLRQFAVACGAAPERVVTIPNGVDHEIFYPRDRVRLRTKHGILQSRKVIVSVGELIEAKGHHHVAHAIQKLVADGVNAELLIVGRTARGGPKYEAALMKDIASLNLGDRIRLVGWADREMVAELLSAADVFCLASYTEGWPNVVQEALACGTPVVATHVGGVPQMIPSSEYGIIVPPKDEAALESALRESLAAEWDRERIATWGRRRCWADVAQEVSQTFEGIVRESTTCGLHEDGPRARRTGA